MRVDEIRFVAQRLRAGRVRKSGSNIMIACPLAPFSAEGHTSGRDRKPSMSIKVTETGPSPLYCFGCHYRGTVTSLVHRLTWLVDTDLGTLLDFVRAAERVDPVRVLSLVHSGYNTEVAEMLEVERIEAEVTADPSPVDVWSEREIAPLLVDEVPEYLVKRGFGEEVLRLGIGYHPVDRRVLFPVRRSDGALIGVVGRHVDEALVKSGATPKYNNYRHFQKSFYLYGEDMVDHASGDPLVVVEGIIDRAWMVSHGFANVVAIMGSSMSRVQARKVIRWAQEADRGAILFLDGDDAGRLGTREAVALLYGRLHLLHVETPPGTDPGGTKPRMLRKLLREAGLVVPPPPPLPPVKRRKSLRLARAR